MLNPTRSLWLVSNDEDTEAEEDPECTEIKVTKEEKIRLGKPWRCSLIIKVLGRRVDYMYLNKRLQMPWHPKARMELVAIDDDYFLVKFFSVDDYEFAKYGGPWMILEHYLIVKDWKPNFDPKVDKTDCVIVRVRFPDFPVEYYEHEFLRKIGERIGEPKYIDEATSLVSRGRFARMCVEVDITKPLLSKFKLKRRIRTIEYKGIHLIYFKCGIYGHRDDKCKNNGEDDGGLESENQSVADETRNGEEAEKETRKICYPRDSLNIRLEISESYGAWMFALRRFGRRMQNWKGKGNSERKQEKVHGKSEEKFK